MGYTNEDYIEQKEGKCGFLDDIVKSKGYDSFKRSGTYQTNVPSEKTCQESEITNMIKNPPYYLWIRMTSKNKDEYFDSRDKASEKYTTDLDIVAKNIGLLNKEIILITGDGDRKVPSSFKDETVNIILNCKYIIRWYTQNYDGTCSNKKLCPYPIGLDLHSGNTHINTPYLGKLPFMLELREQNTEKYKNTIFSDVHLTNLHLSAERKKLAELLKNNEREHIRCLNRSNHPEHHYQGRIMVRELFMDYYNKYPFCLSIHGHGLDVHRTWEILLLGGIVITKTSSLDKMYEGLPVVIVKEWDEILDINNVKKWYEKYSPLTKSEYLLPRLTYRYWLTKIYD